MFANDGFDIRISDAPEPPSYRAAQEVAARIKASWAARGYKIDVWVVQASTGSRVFTARDRGGALFGLRSTLVNGLPPALRRVSPRIGRNWRAEERQAHAPAHNMPVRLNSFESLTLALQDDIRAICDAHGLPLEEVLGPSRRRPVVQARWNCFAHLSAAGLSTPNIGRIFNGRDHATVIHGLQQWDALPSKNAIENRMGETL